jgi:hypothetical protein
VTAIAYLSEQYRIELLGVIICFSQTVLSLALAGAADDAKYRWETYQKFRKLTAIESSSSQDSVSTSLRWALALLLLWECVRFDRGAGRVGRAGACTDLFEW